MSQQTSMGDSSITNRLLRNLNLAIDEARLVHTIVELSDEIRRIQSAPKATTPCHHLRREIARRECELADIRNQVTLINLLST